MSRTIERAIDDLVSRQEPITVRNVITAYLQIVNFADGDVEIDDAIVAFEHALDKHPLPLAGQHAAYYYRPYVLEVDQLRREYWAQRMGGAKCTCGKCGCPIFEETQTNVDALDQSTEALYEIPKEKQRTKGNKRKSRKRLAKKHACNSTVTSLRSTDPCSPSTSTAL